jgi:hypothetical protein
MSAPPASSVTVTAGQLAQEKVPGGRTREVTLDPGASADTSVRSQGSGGSLPGSDACHPLQVQRVPRSEGMRITRAPQGQPPGSRSFQGGGPPRCPPSSTLPSTWPERSAPHTRTIRVNWRYVRPEKQTVGLRAPRQVSLPIGQAQCSSNVQQRPLTTASQHDHQLPNLVSWDDGQTPIGAASSGRRDRSLATGYTRDDLGSLARWPC